MKRGKFGRKTIFGGIIGLASLFLLFTGISHAGVQKSLSGSSQTSAITAGHAGHSLNQHASYTPNEPLVPVVVSKEVDGDTIHVKLPDGADKTIRMLLIDTPEDVKPNTPVEPYSLQAAAFARSQLSVGKHVYIEEGKPGYTLDKYGRLLAYVYITKTDMYNEDVVLKGLARVAYIYPPNTNHLSNLESDEQYARSHKLGIWSLPGYVTSSGYNMSAIGSKSLQSSHSTSGSKTYSSASATTHSGIIVISSNLSVSDGGYASVTIQTSPHALGKIEVDYKSGKSHASGLVNKNADDSGDITWEWKIGSNTTRGNWPVLITAGGKTVRLTLHVG